MFNKFTKKLGEEFNQAKHLVQMISPSASVNSLSTVNKNTTDSAPAVLEPVSTTSSAMFSIADDTDSTFDLTANSPSIMPTRSRRDSLSSVASDASSLFPIYEDNFNHNQSEWESELDESTLNQLETINKAHLYQGYKKLLNKYQKYKERCLILSRSNSDLQRENTKTKNVLQESQDKSLMRIEELREQCQLEQKAKAHLEESLRNDLEERDHLIATLQTKIDLLKSGQPDEENDSILIDFNSSDLQSVNNELVAEVSRLKKIIENVSSGGGAEHVKETITQLKSGIVRMKSENENISNLLSKSPGDVTENGALIDLDVTDEQQERIRELNLLLSESEQRVSKLASENIEEKARVATCTEKLEEMKRALEKLVEERDAVKHREGILVKENTENLELIKKLGYDLEESRNVETEIKATAKSKLAAYEAEIIKLKEAVSKATEIRDDALKKLEVDAKKLSKAAQISRRNEIDKEKGKIESSVRAFFEAHQNKLEMVLQKLDDKLVKAEGNIVRICADKLIDVRSTEMELHGKIDELKQSRDESLGEASKISCLEQELENLRTALKIKDEELLEKAEKLAAVDYELNEKIDRIVELGLQLEETNANHQMLVESNTTKSEKFTKIKTELEEKIQQLNSQIQTTVEENLAFKTINIELEAKLSELQKESTSLREEKAVLCTQVTSLTEEVSSLQASLDEKATIVRDLQQAAEASINHLQETNTKAEEFNQKLEAIATEKRQLVTERDQLERNVAELTKQLQETAESHKLLLATNQDLESKLKDCNNYLVLLSDEKMQLLARVSTLTDQMSSLQTDLNDKTALALNGEKIANETHKRLEESNQAAENLNKILEKVTAEKNQLIADKSQLESTFSEKSASLDATNQLLEKNQGKLKESEREIQILRNQYEERQGALNSLESELKDEREKLKKLENEHASELSKLSEESENRLKTLLTEKEASLKTVTENYETCKKELEDLQETIKSERDKTREECDRKVNILKNEIKFLNEKFVHEVGSMESNSEREVSELRQKLTHSESMADELLKKLEDSSLQREELEHLCQERALKVGELESCLTDLKTDLDRNFNESTKMNNAEFEEAYESKLKDIVADFEKKLAVEEERRKQLEIQAAENSELLLSIPALRVELKNQRAELKEKDNLLETKIEELENLRKESENRIINAKIDSGDLLELERGKFEERLATQKMELEVKLRQEKENSERAISDTVHSVKLDAESKVELLESQLKTVAEEKKSEEERLGQSVEINEDLEATSKIAVAAVASSTESLELMRKQLMSQAEEIKELKKQHRREVTELRKLAMIRTQSLNRREGEDVEHEYLRNILYEYMMGREQLVLAKVLAAIVKFDRQQTSNILERQQSANSLRLL